MIFYSIVDKRKEKRKNFSKCNRKPTLTSASKMEDEKIKTMVKKMTTICMMQHYQGGSNRWQSDEIISIIVCPHFATLSLSLSLDQRLWMIGAMLYSSFQILSFSHFQLILFRFCVQFGGLHHERFTKQKKGSTKMIDKKDMLWMGREIEKGREREFW